MNKAPYTTKAKLALSLGLALSLLLSSCGFRAVHDKRSFADQCSFDLEVKQLDSVAGVEFYNHLNSIMPKCKSQQKHYYLEYDIDLNKDYNIVKSNSDILNRTVTMKVTYKLIDKSGETRKLEGNFSRFASYVVNSSPYSNYSVNKKLINSLAIASAQEMKNILLHFSAASMR